MTKTQKSYQEFAREWDEKIESGREAEGLTPIRARVKRNADSQVSFRLSAEDFRLFSAAARERGLSLSAFLRQAAYAVLSGETSLDAGERRQQIEEARDSAAAVAARLEKLLVADVA
jgi:uncharacterized protein (DUF1778 family)